MKGIVYRNSKTDPGWFVSRYTLDGHRIRPTTVWRHWQGLVRRGLANDAGARAAVAWEYSLTAAEVDVAIAWCERRSAAARGPRRR